MTIQGLVGRKSFAQDLNEDLKFILHKKVSYPVVFKENIAGNNCVTMVFVFTATLCDMKYDLAILTFKQNVEQKTLRILLKKSSFFLKTLPHTNLSCINVCFV